MTHNASPALLREIRARHLAYIEERLASAEAEAEWRANCRAGLEALLDARLGDVAPGSILADAIDRLLSPELLERVARPLSRELLAVAMAELSKHEEPLGARFPPAARERVELLLARPGLVPARLIRETLEQEAMEEMMREILRDALNEFFEKANPFFGEWGIAGLLKKLTPFGIGVTKTLETVKAEFDRRLEPEIRKFLQGFSRRALKTMADVTIQRWDEPSFVAIRFELLAWVLGQKVSDLARSVPFDVLDEAQSIELEIARAISADPNVSARRRELIEAAVTSRAGARLAEVLGELGVSVRVDEDARAFADATWPWVRAATRSGPFRAWLASFVGDFYDREISAAAE
jgi:hypothetical protein